MSESKEKVVYIGVHPWGHDDPAEYSSKRDQRLNDPKLNQVLLIERDMLQETMKRYNLNQQRWQGRLFTSPPEIGIPQSGMPYFVSILQRQFPAEKYVLWGAVLELKGEEVRGGCVGSFYKRMASSFPDKTEIDRPFCYIIDLNKPH